MLSKTLLGFLFLLVGVSSGCKSDKPKAAQSAADTAAPGPGKTEADVKAPDASASGIHWIENDYDKAMTLAKSQNKPLLIDMWAAWCHTCIAMQSGTLRDAGLAEQAEQFIWLSIDTEDPANTAVMALFPPKVWPTFFVVSSADASVQATQLGSCSVPAFRDLLTRGQHGHLAQLGDKLAPDSALYQLREGDRLWTESQYAEAAEAYAKALTAGGPTWPHAAATLNRQISALSKLDDLTACAELAGAEVTRMSGEHNSSGADFMDYAGSCAEALPAEQAIKLRTLALHGLDAIYSDAEASLSQDDRSGVLLSARGIAEALELQDKAQEYARTQKALLDAAVAAAKDPIEEMTYIWHQVEVHAYLKEGASILPWVESLERRLPGEYDPPYRKSWLLFQMERYPEAHEALKPALALARGARKGRMLDLDAEIYKAEGNLEMERQLRQATVAYYQGLDAAQVSAKTLAAAQAALAALGEAAAPNN